VTLSITAAGSLAVNLPSVASAFANATPGVSAPAAAQQFQGSIAALSAISGLHQKYDIAAVADFHLIPRLLESSYASWEIVFAGNPVVLAYDPSLSAFNGVNSTNWASDLQTSGVLLGVANASIDPMGYNAIFALQLEGVREGASLSSVYGHFYSGAPGSVAVPNPSTTRVESETQAAALLKAHTVGAFFVYQSYAHSANLKYVPLPSSVDLGATDAASLAVYNESSTTITGTSGPLLIRGAPVLFSITVPLNAPDPTVAAEFVAFLLAREGTTLSNGGFVPLVPAYVDHPSALPSVLVGAAAPLPGVLAAQLG
jgi:molybdate/tungstate transport system substrate-binding protein